MIQIQTDLGPDAFSVLITCDIRDCPSRLESRFSSTVPADFAVSATISELNEQGWELLEGGEALCPDHS